jgi:capsular exopolysaccharide synthesis family protein
MENFMVRENPGSPIGEAYRKIATNIEFANIDNNIKTIMCTSSMPGEGKTTTICNIAGVLIDLGKKVLLLDMDLRKPAVHKCFKLSNRVGLTDVLINKDDFRGYLNSVYKGLDVIASGRIPSNPSEVINSKAIKELIKKMSSNYDYVLIDAPPVSVVSDPITIATYMDAVLLVVAYSETDGETARKAADSLRYINANIIGTVFNKVPVRKKSKYYYSYY